MSADNFLAVHELKNGTFTIRYGYMSDERPGRILARGLTHREAVRRVREIMDDLSVLEYGPYWYFREEVKA